MQLAHVGHVHDEHRIFDQPARAEPVLHRPARAQGAADLEGPPQLAAQQARALEPDAHVAEPLAAHAQPPDLAVPYRAGGALEGQPVALEAGETQQRLDRGGGDDRAEEHREEDPQERQRPHAGPPAARTMSACTVAAASLTRMLARCTGMRCWRSSSASHA